MAVNHYFDSINISAAGLSAERIRMNLIANNIANMHTTRTEEGGPYRRQYVIFEEVFDKVRRGRGGLETRIAPKMIWDPSHPDAVKEGPNQGYVAMPNINPVSEMVDMISAQRAYEANVQAIAAARSIIMRSLDIGK